MSSFVQKLKRHRWKIFFACLAAIAIPVAMNLWVIGSTDARVFTDADALPSNEVGLVLGTSRYLANGRENIHFKARIEAAALLFHAGKVKHLLLSGDNHVSSYDEPSDMKAALMEKGVPESAMTLDYAGFRTLDSVVRAKEIFGQQKLTIITDDFHAHRAAFLAQQRGVDAVVYCSGKIPWSWSTKPRIREYAARVAAVLDIARNKQPKFLGPKVEIHVAQNAVNETS